MNAKQVDKRPSRIVLKPVPSIYGEHMIMLSMMHTNGDVE